MTSAGAKLKEIIFPPFFASSLNQTMSAAREETSNCVL